MSPHNNDFSKHLFNTHIAPALYFAQIYTYTIRLNPTFSYDSGRCLLCSVQFKLFHILQSVSRLKTVYTLWEHSVRYDCMRIISPAGVELLLSCPYIKYFFSAMFWVVLVKQQYIFTSLQTSIYSLTFKDGDTCFTSFKKQKIPTGRKRSSSF